MPQSPRKRTFASTSVDDPGNENFDQRDYRSRRQRTGSTSSIETLFTHRPAPPTKSKALAEKLLNGRQQSIDSTSGKLGHSYTDSIPTTALKPQSVPLVITKRPTRIPIRVKSTRGTWGAVTLEPHPPPVATPILSKSSALAVTEPSSGNKDAELGLAEHPKVLDMQFLPSIPSPPPSPPKPSTDRVIQAPDASSSSKSPPRTASRHLISSLSFPSPKSALYSDRPAPMSGQRKVSVTKEPHQPAAGPKHSAGGHAKDEYGCIHLGASECQLFISFSHTPHYEAWDLSDNGIIACPASLYLMAREPHLYEDTPLSIPDVSMINIECHTRLTSTRFSEHTRDQDRWSAQFEGAEVPWTNGTSPPKGPMDSIALENNWERVYLMPTIGKNCQQNLPSRNPPLTARPPLKAGISQAAPGRGWVMHFWIPVPTPLFVKKETRVFEISAKAWLTPLIGTSALFQRMYSNTHNSSKGRASQIKVDMESDFVAASTEMTVSHLHKEREMRCVD